MTDNHVYGMKCIYKFGEEVIGTCYPYPGRMNPFPGTYTSMEIVPPMDYQFGDSEKLNRSLTSPFDWEPRP